MNVVRALRKRLTRVHVAVELESVAAYALWAASYPPYAHNALMQVEDAAVRELLPEVRGQRVLDLGSGTGRYSQILRDAGVVCAVPVDNSYPMLLRSQVALRVQGGVAALPLAPASFDGVVCGLVLGHVADIVGAFAEVGRVLRPHGWFVFSDFHPYLARAGMQRTFATADGAQYAVEHFIHTLDAYAEAARQTGLQIVRVLEPEIVPPGRKEAVPAVMVIALRKGGL